MQRQILSPNAQQIARFFNIQNRTEPRPRHRALPIIYPNQILLITGPSGSGKSTLFRKLRQRQPNHLDLSALDLPLKPVIDCFPNQSLHQTLHLLARIGLSEAWSYLKCPDELSEGQRYRLRLAFALSHLRSIRKTHMTLIADEFCALLDRVTAMVVARNLRKIITATPNLSAIVATSHDDLEQALAPDHVITCDFGKSHYKNRSRP